MKDVFTWILSTKQLVAKILQIPWVCVQNEVLCQHIHTPKNYNGQNHTVVHVVELEKLQEYIITCHHRRHNSPTMKMSDVNQSRSDLY